MRLTMGGDGESGVIASCWGFEEAQSIAPFLFPKFLTNWEIKQMESNRETIPLLLPLNLMLENVACIAGKCASYDCTLESGSPFYLAEMEGAPYSWRQPASQRKKREQLGYMHPWHPRGVVSHC